MCTLFHCYSAGTLLYAQYVVHWIVGSIRLKVQEEKHVRAFVRGPEKYLSKKGKQAALHQSQSEKKASSSDERARASVRRLL